MLIRKMNSIVP